MNVPSHLRPVLKLLLQLGLVFLTRPSKIMCLFLYCSVRILKNLRDTGPVTLGFLFLALGNVFRTVC